MEAVLRNRKQRQASKKVRRLYYRRFFGAAFFHVQGTAQRCNHFSFLHLVQELKKESKSFLSFEVSRPARKRRHKRGPILSGIPPPVPPAAVGVVHVRARRRRRVRRGWLSKSLQSVTSRHQLSLTFFVR